MDSSQDASREKDSGASNSPHAPPPDRCHLIKRILRAIFRPILWYWGAPAGRTRRLVVAGMLVIAVVATAYLLLPRIDKSLMNTTSVGNPGYDAWIDAVRQHAQGLGTDVVDERVLPVGVMAQVEATMLCEHKGTGVTGGIFCHEPTPRERVQFRRDRLLLLAGGWVVFLLLLAAVAQQKQLTASGRDGDADTVAPTQLRLLADIELSKQTATTERMYKLLLSMSLYLLVGGVAMAFIGIAIFYLTLPEREIKEEFHEHLLRLLRPTAILLFVESVAWFLLRQYRALAEDYKSFFLLYLRRSNRLAGLRILTDGNFKEDLRPAATVLMNEDLTNRLKPGESTEALEVAKVIDSNPGDVAKGTLEAVVKILAGK